MPISTRWFIWIWVVCTIPLTAYGKPASPSLRPDLLNHKPNLVVVLVIDQFRADYLTRFRPRFLPAHGAKGRVGGFRYLIEAGAYYPVAEYDILQSMTGPGHATILTGSYPYQNGVALNDWFDRERNQRMYCAGDDAQPLVSASDTEHAPNAASPSAAAAAVTGSTAVSTAVSKNPRMNSAVQKMPGFSPRNLIGSTVGDELKNAGYPSRVVAIALKDRAAIMLGGHRADIALWFDPTTQRWVSSRYYLPQGALPEWVGALNTALEKSPHSPAIQVEGAGSGLSLVDPMASDNYYVHALGGRQAALGAAARGATDTVAAAKQAMQSLHLGGGRATDLLAISFSSHDYLGHGLGPNSREMEELTVQEDAAIADLLNHIRTTVPGGLRQTLIVLTGDHGIPPNPVWLKSQRMDAGYFDEKTLTQSLNERLQKKYGAVEGGWISFVTDLNFFINSSAIRLKKLDPRAVENDVRTALEELTRADGGVAHIFTATDVRERKLPAGMHERQILHTFYPGRSGDVIIIPKPYFSSAGATVTHMTGYSYDRSVPLVLAGPHIQAGLYATPAHVIDIAPTLSFLLGLLPPALSEGRVLSEILKQ